MSDIGDSFPHFAAGPVVKGFGRGSKELGIPTANFPDSVVSALPSSMCTGIYYGWAKVMDGPVYKMVMSVGWNPYYKNSKKSMETHIIHQFSDDFYGSWLRVVVLGYIRPEQNFGSLDELITAIHADITVAERVLSSPKYRDSLRHPFLTVPVSELQQPGGVERWAQITDVCGAEDATCNAVSKANPSRDVVRPTAMCDGVTESDEPQQQMSNGHDSL